MTPGLHNTAFRKIYESTHSKVYHFVLKLSWNNKELTHDIVQDCYVKLWNTIETPDEGVNYLPLLYTISKNLLINAHRKMLVDQRRKTEWQRMQTDSTGDSTELYLRHKDSNEIMEKMLAQMPERRRRIYILCKEEGLSHKEIAGLLNISKDTVEQQMHLSMKHLRKELSKKIVPFLVLLAAVQQLVSWMK
ncbi:MAG: RNA polymerase sigma-70 factor [Chitinophagaceae bacterium]|nr:RNA polymerase sigma-70 factor [Chitinophagaceae bacterium]